MPASLLTSEKDWTTRDTLELDVSAIHNLSFSARVRGMMRGLRRFLGPAPCVERAPDASRHPQQIGAWKVLGVIGEGMSATVFRVVPAWAPGVARHFALKLHDGRLAGDRDARDRFGREMRILGSVKHRNIVNMVETGEHEGRQFIVMDLVEGRSLRHALQKYQPQLVGKLDWAIQIARALGAMHARGIVHRDLKPENILATRNGVIKIADFGLARGQEPSAPNGGLLVGTPAYMAPEYLLGAPPDNRSDLYSCGVILYELFTGTMPYDAVTLGDFIEAHIEAPPIPPRARAAVLPHGLEAAILRLLEKNPARRYQSAEELRFALERVQAEALGTSRVA